MPIEYKTYQNVLQLWEGSYEIKVLDLISMEKSHCYNPFVYLQNDNDTQSSMSRTATLWGG